MWIRKKFLDLITMYKYIFLMFFGLGVHSRSVPLKISSFSPPNATILCSEILHDLQEDKEEHNGRFTTPKNLECRPCFAEYTQMFIVSLHQMLTNKSDSKLQRVTQNMKALQNVCSELHRNNTHNQTCKSLKTSFPLFKDKLVTFVREIKGINCNKMTEDTFGITGSSSGHFSTQGRKVTMKLRETEKLNWRNDKHNQREKPVMLES
ncbi:uncharacterized protein LOC114806573 [Ornithorhynchus anatinus]|uniref:uncharacterized protein LOC114806573 n=1 Tax=Ornithorhynchus anatinus TaxID=9258 RepID=UPI0010A75D5B|nr:uncharacterized protein LOC114806573 [Ornithorhynchus anatinus]